MNRIWAGSLVDIAAEDRWASHHDEGWTITDAVCRNCGEFRIDVPSQWCNARHPDGRLRVEALMLAVAAYGRCDFCGEAQVDLLTLRELDPTSARR